MTPRASAVLSVGNHHFRTSYQTGFRNPTPVDQYIKLNAGPITILGGVPDNSDGMNVYENSFTASSSRSGTNAKQGFTGEIRCALHQAGTGKNF